MNNKRNNKVRDHNDATVVVPTTEGKLHTKRATSRTRHKYTPSSAALGTVGAAAAASRSRHASKVANNDTYDV